MNLKLLWKKLFSTYLVLGVLNVLLALVFLNKASTVIIEERARDQLYAVSAFAEHGLRSYFENLRVKAFQKTQALMASGKIEDPGHSLVGVGILHKRKLERKWGRIPGTLSEIEASKVVTFAPLGKSHFLLVVPFGKEKVVWVFGFDGVNQVLSRREGMGETGEVYLVGEDHHIKSGSRHVSDWQEAVVQNEATRRARQNQRGSYLVKDYRGVEVLSTSLPFHLDELSFVLLSEMDRAEVFSSLNQAIPKVALFSLLFLFFSLFAAVLVTRKMMKFINRMKRQLNDFNLNIINAVEAETAKLSVQLSGVTADLDAVALGFDERGRVDDGLLKNALGRLETLGTALNANDEIRKLGLFGAVEALLRRSGLGGGLETSVWINQRLSELELPDSVQINVYRIVQEVTSILLQQNASQFSSVFMKQDPFLLIRMEIVSAEKLSRPRLTALLNYRVELLEGETALSGDEHSVVITVKIPLAPVKS